MLQNSLYMGCILLLTSKIYRWNRLIKDEILINFHNSGGKDTSNINNQIYEIQRKKLL